VSTEKITKRRPARKERPVEVQMRPAPRRPEAELAERSIPRAEELRTAPDTPTLAGGSGEPVKPVKRAKRVRRRRILAIVGLVLLIPLVMLGVQGYRIIDAIGQAQNAAVIPLPTRAPRTSPPPAAVSGVAAAPGTPTAAAQTSAGAMVPAGDGTGSPVDPASVATSVPTTIASVNAAPPLETDGSDGADGDGEMSSFDVVRELAEAGTDRGDPGLDSVWDGKTSLTIMVLGVDRREDGGDQNADVIILVKLDLVAKSIQAVSIPRDLLVTIPNHGQGKVNGAYNIGVQEHPDHPAAGVAMMRDTIEDNFGVIIDDYVLLDFQGFEAAIDAVGGVEVEVPYRIVDEAYPTDDYGTEVVIFEPGVQEMDGETALKYARTRNVDSDDGRRQRQADILLALFDEAKDLGSITRASNIIMALGDSVQTSFPLDQQLTLARIGLDMDRSAIDLEAIPDEMLTEGYDDTGAWVYIADISSVATFIQGELGISPIASR
jgi:LCP family protein required for cell wall assembly